MNQIKKLLIVAAASFVGSVAFAQVQTPAASPASTLKQVVGLTNFTVEYSRPGAKDRQIFGDLVPYGELWRTGANASTKITFDKDIKVGGKSVPAGTYALLTIPRKDEWTVIFHKKTDLWGTRGYEEKNDAVRVTVKPAKISPYLETFTIGFEHLRDESAILHLDWANTRVPVKITLDTIKAVEAGIEEAMKSPENLKAGDYASAASFYLDHGKDLDKAEAWMKKAISENENAFWWQHTYAKILAKQGKKDKAREYANLSIKNAKASGSDFGYVDLNKKLIASLD